MSSILNFFKKKNSTFVIKYKKFNFVCSLLVVLIVSVCWNLISLRVLLDCALSGPSRHPFPRLALFHLTTVLEIKLQFAWHIRLHARAEDLIQIVAITFTSRLSLIVFPTVFQALSRGFEPGLWVFKLNVRCLVWYHYELLGKGKHRDKTNVCAVPIPHWVCVRTTALIVRWSLWWWWWRYWNKQFRLGRSGWPTMILII